MHTALDRSPLTPFRIALRVAALAVVAMLFAGGSLPATTDTPLAGTGFGTCSPTESSGCITQNAAYEDYWCSGGQGQDCITCQASSGEICTWDGGDLQGYRDPFS